MSVKPNFYNKIIFYSITQSSFQQSVFDLNKIANIFMPRKSQIIQSGRYSVEFDVMYFVCPTTPSFRQRLDQPAKQRR